MGNTFLGSFLALPDRVKLGSVVRSNLGTTDLDLSRSSVWHGHAVTMPTFPNSSNQLLLHWPIADDAPVGLWATPPEPRNRGRSPGGVVHKSTGRPISLAMDHHSTPKCRHQSGHSDDRCLYDYGNECLAHRDRPMLLNQATPQPGSHALQSVT
jgi:hypothetical protein